MIVYTVQPEFLYKKMREQGYLEGNKAYAMFPEAYQWMIQQMMKRIGHKNEEVYPIWVWKRVPKWNEDFLYSIGEETAHGLIADRKFAYEKGMNHYREKRAYYKVLIPKKGYTDWVPEKEIKTITSDLSSP